MFDKLIEKVILKRTGFKALVNNQMITGCGQCTFNKEVKGFPVAGHQCSMTLMNNGQNAIIFDPYNIPEFCPFKFKEADGSLVSGVQ